MTHTHAAVVTSCGHPTLQFLTHLSYVQDGSKDGGHWSWRGPEMHAVRRLLRALAVHSIRSKVGGVACLRRLAVAARAATARGVLHGYDQAFLRAA